MAYSRATNLTILACPLNMQGMPGALQVLAALLHGVQTIYTYDGREPTIRGSLDLTAIQVEQATAAFQQALLPHELWSGPLPVCLAEHHEGKARRLRLVLATLSHLTKAEISCLWVCLRCFADAGMASHTRWTAVGTLAAPAQ